MGQAIKGMNEMGIPKETAFSVAVNKVSPSESRKREAMADLTSAKFSEAVDGGIYLFEI